jgi:hypothetical protein
MLLVGDETRLSLLQYPSLSWKLLVVLGLLVLP